MLNLEEMLAIYQIITDSTQHLSARKESILVRKKALQQNQGIVKLAFDTRRFNSEIEFNPRRGLQNYHRSEQFISQALHNKIQSFQKLREILQELKEKFQGVPEWQDSYARVLLNALDRGLRTIQQDDDYSNTQPGVGSLDYLEELLYVRYRLTIEDLDNLSTQDIKTKILSIDEELTKKDIKNKVVITKNEAEHGNYDNLIDKLFGGVKATKENPEVERTVTITIKDKFIDPNKEE